MILWIVPIWQISRLRRCQRHHCLVLRCLLAVEAAPAVEVAAAAPNQHCTDLDHLQAENCKREDTSSHFTSTCTEADPSSAPEACGNLNCKKSFVKGQGCKVSLLGVFCCKRALKTGSHPCNCALCSTCCQGLLDNAGPADRSKRKRKRKPDDEH